jgi:DNA polymerase I-like protein with 3'-5' exonuclease and polymerase domains
MAHHKPNMAQVPAVYSPYGKECRELWTISNPDTHQLVGTDASGLELRCLAHYMEDEKFTNEVLTGDVHTANQKAAGLQTRDQAKTFIYAFLYGAGPGKIGTVVGGSWTEGEELIAKFLKNMPSLNRLRKTVTEAAKSGRITGLDGRKLHIRHEHAALNTLLQGAGAIVCKQWLVEMDHMIWEHGLDAKLVASVHDEYQFEVAKPDIDSFTKITREAMKATQNILNFKCDLDCDYKVGNNWAETH